jgi:hypothetical protein
LLSLDAPNTVLGDGEKTIPLPRCAIENSWCGSGAFIFCLSFWAIMGVVSRFRRICGGLNPSKPN